MLLLERAWQATARHLATLFLMIAVVTVPLHVVYGFLFQDTIAVRALHTSIERLPPGTSVQGVNDDDIVTARRVHLALGLVELALLPLFVGATRRVLEVGESEGDLPAIADALRHSPSRIRPLGPVPVAPFVAAVLFAALVTILAQWIGRTLAEPLSNEVAFVGRAVAEGAARALGAPWLLTVWALGMAPAENA